MSNHKRSFHSQLSVAKNQSTLARVESELANGYVQVPVDGLAFTQFIWIYVALAKFRMRNSVRSLLRLHPAH